MQAKSHLLLRLCLICPPSFTQELTYTLSLCLVVSPSLPLSISVSTPLPSPTVSLTHLHVSEMFESKADLPGERDVMFDRLILPHLKPHHQCMSYSVKYQGSGPGSQVENFTYFASYCSTLNVAKDSLT